MIDLLTRALRHPTDYLPALRRRTLFLQAHYQESESVHTFVFTPTQPISWRAGQHAIFTLPEADVQGKTWRPFSVASSPHEGVIQISTTIPPTPSDFKKKLLTLRDDDPVVMYGPYGEFHAHQKAQHIVGIAGGIGITPFRALAYEIAHNHAPRTRLTLIYAASGAHPYRAELEHWQHNRLRIHFVSSPEEVFARLKERFALSGNTADYYISGSPAMITSLTGGATKIGITHIINDPFKGYT